MLALVRSEAKGGALKKAGVKLAVGELGIPRGMRAAPGAAPRSCTWRRTRSPQGPELDRKTISSARDLLRGQVGATFIYTSGCWVQGATEGGWRTRRRRSSRRARWRGAPRTSRPRWRWRRTASARWWCGRASSTAGRAAAFPAMFFGTALKHGAAQTVGPGENHWPLVHVDDLAELYVRLVERAPAGSVYDAADASRPDPAGDRGGGLARRGQGRQGPGAAARRQPLITRR